MIDDTQTPLNNDDAPFDAQTTDSADLKNLDAPDFIDETIIDETAATADPPTDPDLAASIDAEIWQAEQDKLALQFGGKSNWSRIKKTLAQWGTQNVPPELYANLVQSSQGVISLYRMMRSTGEPSLMGREKSVFLPDETALKKMMADPRYWRERDPALMRQVANGFARLYREDQS